MASKSCVYTPDAPNGKPSRMYKDLLNSIRNRPLVNLIYAGYTASNMADTMDQAGYARNSQGQHNAEDIKKFINYAQIANEIGGLSTEEKTYGFVDQNGQRVDFADAKVALDLADKFNERHTALVANVYQHGDNFQIIVSEKNARTHMQPTEVKERLKVWEVEKQFFSGVGIDIDNMPQALKKVFNPYNLGLVQRLQNLKRSQFNYLYKEDALILFNLNANSPQVQRLVGSFGSLEDAAQAVDNINHGINNYSSAQQRLLMGAITHSLQFHNMNLDVLENQVQQMTQQVTSSSPEETIRQELHKLNKKYKIGINEVHRTRKKIDTLSEAANEAVITLERQIREIEKQLGITTQGKRLESIKNQLLNEIANKKYSAGILNFLSEAATSIQDIDTMLSNLPQTGTELQKAFDTARMLQDIKQLRTQYYDLLEALANEHLTIDESIDQRDIDNIRQSAKNLKDLFDKKDKVINDLIERTMINLMTEIVGDTAPNGQAIANVIRMAQADSSMFDWLYSVGRASNPIIGAMGSIIRNAQLSRNAIMDDFALRIRRATDKLHKSGSNSSFMYEADNVHLVSDIDWTLYNDARKTEAKRLFNLGYQAGTFDFKQAMQSWEDANTEDRVVNNIDGRTEKVPNQLYRKAMPAMTQAQQEYYTVMMQIKGEIGSMLPAYAQQQYLAPQIRRSMLDAIGKAKNAQDVVKAIKLKAENFYKIREDDTDYNWTPIEGQDYKMVESDYDNTPLREIPIFFVRRLEDSDELLKEFSTGLQALAGTAVNYQAMNNVAQVVEFVGDFAKKPSARDTDPKADHVENKAIRITYDLFKWAKRNNNTEQLINGFISQHLYGQKLDPNQPGYKWAKAVSNLIGYTSFKGLATNVKGAFSNYLVGEMQMLIEAGCGEFYGLKDYAWAHTKLFGGAGVGGEIAELLTNNKNHKATLFREMFDPINESFENQRHTKYYNSMFRQLVSHDCSFIGYASGEYLIHYVNMYAILHHQKVLLNGKRISLYDAFEVGNKQDGNSELVLKQGVTTLDGQQITQEWLDKIKGRIRYCNQTCHGSMNDDDKGVIHQKLWGRAVMNFRQWMVEHYSRRFRKRHFDASLGEDREGYWRSLHSYLFNEDTKDKWEDSKIEAVGLFLRDFWYFTIRAQSQWNNLTEEQKYNVKRVHSEMTLYVALLGLSFALGDPDRHKREFWHRWWIYQVKRLIMDTEASLPPAVPPFKSIKSGLTILQSPIAGVNTLNSLLYCLYGLTNGDLFDEIKSGDHKGENRYWRNVKKYVFPVFKDIEQMQKMSEDESIFQVFKDTPTNR